MPISSRRKLLSAILAALIPFTVYAHDLSPEARLQQLEQMVQQRVEQDKQIELLTKELVGIESQVSQSKIIKSEEKGNSQGNPVYGGFKDGLVFEDGTGNWKLQLNGRAQVDYRTYSPDEWKNDTFSIRRARLGATFSFLKDFTVRVEGEYASDNT